jgi:hypothetical protein
VLDAAVVTYEARSVAHWSGLFLFAATHATPRHISVKLIHGGSCPVRARRLKLHPHPDAWEARRGITRFEKQFLQK